jgi:hypothetical protein
MSSEPPKLPSAGRAEALENAILWAAVFLCHARNELAGQPHETTRAAAQLGAALKTLRLFKETT